MVDSTYWGSKTPKFSRTHVMTFFTQCIKVPHEDKRPLMLFIQFRDSSSLIFQQDTISQQPRSCRNNQQSGVAVDIMCNTTQCARPMLHGVSRYDQKKTCYEERWGRRVSDKEWAWHCQGVILYKLEISIYSLDR